MNSYERLLTQVMRAAKREGVTPALLVVTFLHTLRAEHEFLAMKVVDEAGVSPYSVQDFVDWYADVLGEEEPPHTLLEALVLRCKVQIHWDAQRPQSPHVEDKIRCLKILIAALEQCAHEGELSTYHQEAQDEQLKDLWNTLDEKREGDS